MERNPSASVESAAGAVEAILRHLEQGAPWDACDAFREAIDRHPHDVELLYFGALAHARSGATHAARTLLDRAEAASPDSKRLTDILSLRGRLWKDAYHRAPDAPGANASTILSPESTRRRCRGYSEIESGRGESRRKLPLTSRTKQRRAISGTSRPQARRSFSSGSSTGRASRTPPPTARPRATRAALRRCGARSTCSPVRFPRRARSLAFCLYPTSSRLPGT